MYLASFSIATIGLLFFISSLVLIMKKLRYINILNLSIFVVLALFWIIISMFEYQLVTAKGVSGFKKWEIPLLDVIALLIPAILRIPFSLLSRYFRSRKLPILISFALSTIFILPFLIVRNHETIWLLAIAIGFFGATFGLENIYFSENWTMNKAFITVALIALFPVIGHLIALMIVGIFHLTNDSGINYFINNEIEVFLIIAFVLYIIVGVFFYFKVHEDKETIRKEISKKGLDAQISTLRLKDLFRLIGVIMASAIASKIFLGKEVIKNIGEDEWELVKIIVAIFTGLLSLFVGLFLVVRVRTYKIIIISQCAAFIGILTCLILIFLNVANIGVSIFLFILITGSFSIYEATFTGVVVHTEHRNRMLVFSIWLTFRSLAFSLSSVFGGEMLIFVNDAEKWLMSAGAAFMFVSIIASIVSYEKLGVVYKVADLHENKLVNAETESIWK